MQVKCISNEVKDLPKDLLLKWSVEPNAHFPLIIGKNYIVYAMTIEDNYAWYYICDENYFYYPIYRVCPLFEVVNNKISRYWVFTYLKGENYIKANAVWAFPEWAEDPDYYDRLTDGRSDGYDKEVDLFEKYKELMDLEFPDPSVSESASIVDAEWLMCNSCIDAWYSTNVLDALVRCPYCQQKLNNPRYIPDFRDSIIQEKRKTKAQNDKQKLNSRQNQIVESNAKHFQDEEYKTKMAKEAKIAQEMDKKADIMKAQDQAYDNKQHEIKKMTWRVDYHPFTEQDHSITYQYDALNRLIKRTCEGKTTTFTYNAFNRCLSITDEHGKKQLFYQR